MFTIGTTVANCAIIYMDHVVFEFSVRLCSSLHLSFYLVNFLFLFFFFFFLFAIMKNDKILITIITRAEKFFFSFSFLRCLFFIIIGCDLYIAKPNIVSIKERKNRRNKIVTSKEDVVDYQKKKKKNRDLHNGQILENYCCLLLPVDYDDDDDDRVISKINRNKQKKEPPVVIFIH